MSVNLRKLWCHKVIQITTDTRLNFLHNLRKFLAVKVAVSNNLEKFHVAKYFGCTVRYPTGIREKLTVIYMYVFMSCSVILYMAFDENLSTIFIWWMSANHIHLQVEELRASERNLKVRVKSLTNELSILRRKWVIPSNTNHDDVDIYWINHITNDPGFLCSVIVHLQHENLWFINLSFAISIVPFYLCFI